MPKSLIMARNNVLLIEDHSLVREGVQLILEKQLPGCAVVGASTWAETQQLLESPGDLDWVLLDLGLPDIAGLDALTRLRTNHPELPVVVLSSTEDRALVLECINRGAAGFVAKSASARVLTDALHLIFAGGIYLPPSLFGHAPAAAEQPEQVLSSRREELARRGLTPRQIEVLELVVQGLSNKHIASRLGVGEATVKTHVAAGLHALNVKNRTQAAFVLAQWDSPTKGPRPASNA